MRYTVALVLGTIIILVLRIFAGKIGLFSPVWWMWILMQVFIAGAAGFSTAITLVTKYGWFGGQRGANTPTAD